MRSVKTGSQRFCIAFIIDLSSWALVMVAASFGSSSRSSAWFILHTQGRLHRADTLRVKALHAAGTVRADCRTWR